MPELPEVETTRRGIAPSLENRTVMNVVVRERRLRWPVPTDLNQRLVGARFRSVDRRAKYLLLNAERGTLMIHLGMSGSLRIMPAKTPPLFHDHVDVVLDDGFCMRYRDPRRFGSIHWLTQLDHPLLKSLGPEPLEPYFSGQHLYDLSQSRRLPVKQFIMNARVVVGVGNIYANEALFLAGVHPIRSAGRISLHRYKRIADAIKAVLQNAIEEGGTTLRDFVGGDGMPGYFAGKLMVYGRDQRPCHFCGRALKAIRIGGRATVFCARCQR